MCFRMDVVEHLLNTKVVVFLEFLWFELWFYRIFNMIIKVKIRIGVFGVVFVINRENLKF